MFSWRCSNLTCMLACLYEYILLSLLFPSEILPICDDYSLPTLRLSHPQFGDFSQEVIDDPELDAVWDSFFPSTVPVVPEAGSLPGCSGTGVIYTLRNLSFLPQSWFSRKLAPSERKLLLEGTIFHYHELFPGVYFHVSY